MTYRPALTTLALVGMLSASPSPAQAPGVLARLPADATNLVVVRDLMPHVRAVLAEPLLQRLCDETRGWHQELFGMDLSPAVIERQVSLFSEFVPTEVVAATSPRTMTSLAHALHAAACAAVLLGTRDSEDADARLLASDRLRHALGAITAPAGVVWVRARSERTAEQWFETVFDLVNGLDERFVVDEPDESSVRVRLQPAQLASLQQALRGAGADVSALAELQLEATLQLAGDTLRLTIGTPEPGPLDAARVGKLWRDDASQPFFLHVDCAEGIEIVHDAYDTLQNTPDELDPAMEDSVLRLVAAIERIAAADPVSTTAIDVDHGVVMTIEAELDEEILLEAPPAELVRCIDPEQGPFGLASVTLDLLLSESIQAISNQIMSRARDGLAREVLDVMYGQFGEVIDYIDGEDSMLFESGVVWVTAPARLRSLRVRGGHVETALDDMPLGAMAMLAVALDEASAATFVGDVTRLLAAALGREPDELLREADLGLGVPTRALSWQSLLDPQGAVTLDADFAPHVFWRGNILAFSTDPALSRQLLQRMASAEPIALPIADPLDWRHARGADLAGALRAIASYSEKLGGTEPALLAALTTLANLLATIDVAESHSYIDGTVYREVQSLRLRGAGQPR